MVIQNSLKILNDLTKIEVLINELESICDQHDKEIEIEALISCIIAKSEG